MNGVDRLSDMTWPEARAAFRAGRVIVVPVGAAAKEHGPHLPLGTDRVLAAALAEGLGRRLPVIVAPVIDVGYYPVFQRYPGSQHLEAATFVALVTDILGGFVRQGARRLAVLNTGVSTEAPIGLALRALLDRHGVPIRVAHLRRLMARAADLVGSGGGHADEAETALMLAIAPALVRADRVPAGEAAAAPATLLDGPLVWSPEPAPDAIHNPSGASGDPSRATAAQGEAILQRLVAALVEEFAAAFPGLAESGA